MALANYDVPRYMNGGITTMAPMYMDDGGFATNFGFGNFGTNFTNSFLDDLGHHLTDEELEDYLEAIGDAYGPQNTITYDDAFARGYGAQQADALAEGRTPSKLNYEDTPSNILPGADIRINARDENPAAYRFYPTEVSKLYSQMKGVPFSPLVAPPREATYLDELGAGSAGYGSGKIAPQRRIQSQLYAKDGKYVNAYAKGTGENGVKDKETYDEEFKNIYEKDRNRKRQATALLNDVELKLLRKVERESLDKGMPLLSKYMDLVNFNLGDEPTPMGVLGALPPILVDQIMSKMNPSRHLEYEWSPSAISSQNEYKKVLEKRKDMFGYADGTGEMGVEDYPRRQELIAGPGGEQGDKIPAMLSDGEFVTNAAAVRGMGIMAGANPEDEYEQRLLGARQMYDYQRQAEEMAKRYA